MILQCFRLYIRKEVRLFSEDTQCVQCLRSNSYNISAKRPQFCWWIEKKIPLAQIWFASVESEILWPSMNFVPVEMKARYDKLPWFKVHFCFAGVPSLSDESLSTMYVLELQQQSKTLLSSSACRNILPSKIIKKTFFTVPQLKKPYCNNTQQLFCCFNLCSAVSFHTLLLFSRWGFYEFNLKSQSQSGPLTQYAIFYSEGYGKKNPPKTTNTKTVNDQ